MARTPTARTRPAPDGRTARRDRNRDAVLDAVLELFAEDSLRPGPADVAARSGVSLRSVYRYFEDMDELVRAAMARHLEKVRPLFDLPDLGEGPLADRIDRTVAARVRLHDAVAPLMRAALANRGRNQLIDDRIDQQRAAASAQVAAMFGPELAVLPKADRRELLAVLDVLLWFDAIEQLRRSSRLSAAATRRALGAAVGAVLQAQPPA